MKKFNLIIHRWSRIFFLISLVFVITSCMKEFLDIKRNKSQVIPKTLEDYYSLLENQLITGFSVHQLSLLGSDEYYINSQQWKSLVSPVFKNGYIWADEIFEGESSQDWNRGYEKILYANFILEGVQDIVESPANREFRNEIVGIAQFIRGYTLFNLAQIFCEQYDPQSANLALGLPLRVTSNINNHYPRATLQETYEQILSDLETASLLLPDKMSLYTRPYRGSALAMLANVYLQMGNFEQSLERANEAMNFAPKIVNYGEEVDTTLTYTFPLYGKGISEIMYFDQVGAPSPLLFTNINVDSVLYRGFGDNDIRKHAFFGINSGRIIFKGSYSGTPVGFFTGLTTPEVLLVSAECKARLGDSNGAIKDIRLLIENRYDIDDQPVIGSSITQKELIELVLSERWKELAFRGRRWSDLKRFQKDPALAKSIKRTLDGQDYVLEEQSAKWVWPIPPDVISLSGIIQNAR